MSKKKPASNTPPVKSTPDVDKALSATRLKRSAMQGSATETNGAKFVEGRRIIKPITRTAAEAIADEIGVDKLLGTSDGKDRYVSNSQQRGTKTNLGATAAMSATAAGAEFTSAMSSFGVKPEFDRYDLLDLFALHLVELLQSNVYTFSNLSKYERKVLFRYFYRTNPIIGRVIDLHTDMPLSKLRLQAPKGQPEIVRDYIMQFYERIFERLNVNEIIRDMVLTHWIYGEAYVFVDDCYTDHPRVLQDITALQERVYKHNDEDLQFLQEVESQYSQDPLTVDLQTRLKYIEKKFESFFDAQYTGPTKLSVLRFFYILEYLENPDISFEAVRYQISESLKRLKEMVKTDEELADVGYSEGMLELLRESNDDDSYVIDNDIYSGLPFLFSLKQPDDSAPIMRVLTQALEWDAARRATKAKIERLGQLGRIVTAEGASQDQIDALRTEVQMMLEDPNHAVVANYSITWNEVNSFVKEEISELINRSKDIMEEMAIGLGMPMSLISGESQYSGDTVKLEMLNTYYLSFNQRVRSLLEDKLMKPIALRKGFVTIDAWGNPQLIYPQVSFSRIGIRDATTYDLLFSLYQKGSLPVSIILDILNLDADDVKRAVENDLWTTNDPNMNDLIRSVLDQASADLYADTDVREKLIAALRLKLKVDETPTPQSEYDHPQDGQ